MTSPNGPLEYGSQGDAPKKASGGKFGEVGHEGLYMSAGYVQDEFMPALMGDKAMKTWREMGDNDPVVGGVLHGVKMLARGVEWSIEPDENDGDDEITEFVDSCFHDMSTSWEDTLSQIMSMVQYGWHLAEIVYKKRDGYKPETARVASSKHSDGKIGWRKLPGRAQETRFRWEIDPLSGAILGMHQRVPHVAEAFYIPMQKALLFRTQADKGNPEGRSVLRNAYRPWYFKTRIEQIEAVGIERDLAGFPIVWVPHTMLSADATAEEKQALEAFKDIARNIKRDEQEGLVMPLVFDERGNKMFDISLLSATGRRQFDTDATIARYNQQITMPILADFIMLGHEAVGSKALGASKIDLFMAGLEAWLDSICDVFNTHAIPRLLRVNGMDPMKAPKLTHAKIQSVDPEILGAAIQALATSGMPLFPDDALELHVREAIGLPPKSPDAAPQAMQTKPGDGIDGQAERGAAQQAQADVTATPTEAGPKPSASANGANGAGANGAKTPAATAPARRK